MNTNDRHLLNLLTLLIFLTGSLRAIAAEKGDLIILASIKPLALITEAITADSGLHVDTLVPATVSPHTFALKPSHLKLLRRADYLVLLGQDYEPYIPPSLPLADRRLPLMEVLSLSSSHLEDEEHDHHHFHGEADPHFWLQPPQAVAAARHIRQQLSLRYPEKAARFQENLSQFEQRVEELDRRLRQRLTPYIDVPFLLHHNAYQYWLDHYGFRGEVGVVYRQPGTGLGLKAVRDLQQLARSQRQQGGICLFHEPQFSGSGAPQALLAEGVREAELDPLGSTASSYEELLETLAARWLQCVSGSSG